MSVRTDVVNLNLNINSNKAQNELNNLRKKAADIKFEMQGLKKGTAEYIAKAKEFSQVTNEMSLLKKQIGVTALSQKELIAELNKLKSLRGSVIPFSNEYKELSKSIKDVEKRLYDVKNGVQGFSSFFSKIKDEVKQFGVVAAGYLGFQFITSQFQNIIRNGGKVSDQLADIQRVAGLTSDEAKKLNNEFKELNTRTSTDGLREIAIVAGKLGVAKDDIFDFTKAVDQLVVSLGDELGNADQITSQLGKILTVFDGKITGDNITKLGNAFVQLANTGSATGGFIADFDQRLSGIAKSSGIGLGALSGLGAGLEEMGARVESSSTAIQKLIISIASDIPKAAKIAGLSTAQFNKLFKEDATEALLKYSEGLVKNKKSFSEVTASLAEAGEEGARTIETITKLGTSSDILRKRIDLGKQAIQENSAITEAFNLKNETFGATLDKLGKEFNKLISSPGVTNFLKGAVEGTLSFLRAIQQIPAPLLKLTLGIGALILGIALLNSGMIQSAKLAIVQAARTLAISVASYAAAAAITIHRLATSALIASQAAYITIVNLFTARITLATAAQRLWTIALSTGLGPLGLLISVVGAVVIGINAMGNSFKNSGDQAKFHAESIKLANEEISKQRSEIDTLTAVIKDNTISLGTRQESLKKLIEISPEYLKGLTLENITTAEGKRILDQYNLSLQTNANLKAAQIIKDREFDKNVKLRSVRQELEIAQKAGTGYGDLSSEAQGAFSKVKTSVGRTNLTSDLFNVKIGASDFAQAFKDIDDEINKSTANQNAATDNYISKQKEKENARRAFLLGEITQLRTSQNQLKKGTAEYEEAGKKYEAARDKYYAEFGSTNIKKAAIGGEDKTPTSPGASKTANKKAEDNTFENLKKDAEKFYKEIKALKNRIDGGEDPEKQEVLRVTAKYQELLLRAKDFYLKSAIDKKIFTEEEKIIEEEKQRELNEIFQKYFKKRFEESSSKEYEQSLIDRANFSDQLKIAAAKDYTEGKISKKQYETELKQIDKDETADRIIIAKDYSTTVKKAAEDVTKFKKDQEKQQTADALQESEQRVINAQREELAKAKRAVLTSKPNSQERLDAQKEVLRIEYEQEIENADLTHEELLLKEDEYNEARKNLDNEYYQAKIQQIVQYVNYFQQALTSLNQFISNRENAEFNKEKALFQKKRKEYKAQLDSKLISQAQYDKKLNELQEEQDKKERELKRKQAKRDKAINIFSALVNTASAVAEALPNIGLAIAAGVLGALQVAAIASTPLPEAGKGKWFTTGDKHSDASGGIPIMIERDEAVMTAAAMTDDKEYVVRGTPSQITSALNSQAGGVNWAGGAIVKKANWITEKPARINPSLPTQLGSGGILRNIDTNTGNNGNEETNTLLRTLIKKQEENTEEIKNMKTKLKAVVSIKEYREEEAKYDAVQKLSGLT